MRQSDAGGSVANAESQLQFSFAKVLARHFSGSMRPGLVIAYSGGLDSHVLLNTAVHWRRQHPRASVRAIYIDHGLQAPSADWALHCEAVCEAAGVLFSNIKVDVPVGNDQSPEEAARKARYLALEQHLEAGECLLTAHHADDQAETLMLQLMRGAGVRGLAAMPERRSMGEGFHLRPFLDVTRATLLRVAQHWKLRWVEDPSNLENRYSRNLLRNSIMPLLKERWPATAVNLSRSASHCAEAAELNRQLAKMDLDQSVCDKTLPVELLSGLSWLRRKNALRYWIEHHGFQPPSTAQLERIDCDLIFAAAESSGQVSFGRAQIRRYRTHMYLAVRENFAQTPPFNYVWRDRQTDLLIAETGDTLKAAQLNLPWLKDDQPVTICSRSGGERIRLTGRLQSHSVKSLLQQKGIPPWQRNRLPFVYVDDQLVGVIGIGFSDKPCGDI